MRAPFALVDVLRDEIAQHGPIPFSRWMEVSLYHPTLGYYRRERNPFGAHGDFYTAEQLDPFAGLLRTFANRLTRQASTVVELGAGRRDLQNAFSDWNYIGHDWDRPELPSTGHGLVLAHEFFDALPVRLLQNAGPTWVELAVHWSGHAFELQRAPWRPTAEVLAYAASYGPALPAASLLEFNETLPEWWRSINSHLQPEHVLVFDYGYWAEELPRLSAGTLMSFQRHVATEDVLTSPGERDITAHVNFSDLVHHARHSGFYLQSAAALREWALQVWDEQELERQWRSASRQWKLQWKQLVFGMGESFHVLHFSRRIPQKETPPIARGRVG